MSERVDVGDLLTIDVGSELRKLASAQLQGSWQLPAELLRHALRSGARRVQVQSSRQRLRLETDRPVVSRGQLDDLVELADRDAAASRRHEALLRLERAGGPGLLSLVGLGPTRLRVDTGDGFELTLTGSKRGRVRADAAATGQTRIEVEGVRIDRARARDWLSDVARFARAEVTLDGRVLPRGFERAISRTAMSQVPLVDVAIPAEGDVARVWLLMNGVVTTHASVSPAPCFEASMEMSDIVDPAATAADLRATFDGMVGPLVEAVVEHLCYLADRLPETPASVRPRITELMLEAARMRRYPDVLEVPLFFGRDGAGHDRWFSLSEIAKRFERGDRSIAVLSTRQDPENYVVDDVVLFLEESERASLARLMDVSFQPPRHRDELRPHGRLGAARWRALSRQLVDGLVTQFWRVAPIDEAGLDAAEISFLRALRKAVSEPDQPIRHVDFVEGSGPVRRGGDRLLVPRRRPEVVAAIRRHDSDPTHVYLCSLAWLGDLQAPAKWARAAWRRAHDPRGSSEV